MIFQIEFMNETKRIIVEFGVHRQQIHLIDRLISTAKLLHLIGDRFNIDLGKNSSYILQIYDEVSKQYLSMDDQQQIFDLSRNFQALPRFRILNKSTQSQKRLLLDKLQSTVDQLSNATQSIEKIQHLVGSLNQNCDQLNQIVNTRQSNSSCNQPQNTFSYLLDPSAMRKDIETPNIPLNIEDVDDENFDSVSSFEATPISSDHPPFLIPTMITSYKPPIFTTDTKNQTRIIPCKYAVRGTCRLGDKCSYLHDEACIQSAREWERRL